MANVPFSNPFAPKAPDNTPAAPKGETGKGSSATDIMDFLSSDKDTGEEKPAPKEEKPDDVDDEDKSDEDDDKIDIKDDDEEDDEDKEKLDLSKKDDDGLDVDVPPKKSEILKEFPEFFKKFPAIEKMIYRDREWTELLGTVDDAKELVAKADDMAQFESQLLSGRTDDLLKRIKDSDPKAFDKIVDNYLETLEKVDKDAYYEVAGYFTKNVIIKRMVATARAEKDDKLMEAAEALHKYLFNTKEWSEPTKRVAEVKDEAKVALDKERTEFVQQKFESARDGLQSRIDNVLKQTINDHIDPRGVLSAYEKRNAIKDVLNELHSEIGKDKAFGKNLQRLWSNAFDKNFNNESLEALRKNYLGKSRNLIGTVIKRVRQEVLSDKSRKPKEDNDEKEKPNSGEPRKSSNAGRPSQQSGSKAKASQRQPGESVNDFFMRD